jgi:hypothetical protein
LAIFVFNGPINGLDRRWSCGEQKFAKICLPLGITTKSYFVFTRPRPKPVKSRVKIPQRSKP